MSTNATRKGFTRTADIPADILQSLSRGEIPSATLAEGLAVDQSVLVRSVFPGLPAQVLAEVDAVCQLGIAKRMRSMGLILWAALGQAGLQQCLAHPSDTVRGWACFMVAAQTQLSLPERLAAIEPLADDGHFGVREWAWMAIRPQLAEPLAASISALTAWAQHPSERIRRFACEALRPRGVWCSHITALKQQPALALPILQPLRADPSAYVQDSVANWLNDAAKDQPDWVRALCQQWLQASPCAATQRIAARAMRNL